jgi:hypothetical protein
MLVHLSTPIKHAREKTAVLVVVLEMNVGVTLGFVNLDIMAQETRA